MRLLLFPIITSVQGSIPTLPASEKTVWLLWLQGWDSAPWMIREIALSWERHNADWNITRLSEKDLPHYFQLDYWNAAIPAPAKSDIVRLTLLSKYGGVWADATMLCNAPLDSWLPAVLVPTGCWMYHGRDGGRGPASWFIAARRGSYIMETWKNKTDMYWRESKSQNPHDYFWMDFIFLDLMKNDLKFMSEWAKVPYLNCEAAGQAHMLVGKVQREDADLQRILERNPPYALKLSRHGFPDEIRDDATKRCNGYVAIQLSYRTNLSLFHPMTAYPFPSSSSVVAPENKWIRRIASQIKEQLQPKCKRQQFGKGGGGHSLCTASTTNCRFISYGVANDWSFETDLSRMNCSGVSFDPTVDLPNIIAPNVVFIKAGAEMFQTSAFPTVSVLNAVKWFGPQLFALKIDCEGCEYAIIRGPLKQEDVDMFSLIENFNLEIHAPRNYMRSLQHLEALDRLFQTLHLAGHELVHIDGGGCSPADEGLGCLEEFKATGFPCSPGCRSLLFSRKEGVLRLE